MRAVHLNDWRIENINFDEVSDPTPAAGEVLIATEAAAINPADGKIRDDAEAMKHWDREYQSGWEPKV